MQRELPQVCLDSGPVVARASSRRSLDPRSFLRERYAYLVAGNPLCSWIKDAELRYVAVSPGFEDCLQRRARDLVGHRDTDFYSAREAARFATGDLRALESRMPIVALSGCDDGGFHRTVKLPLCDDLGHVVGTVGIACGSGEVSPAKQSTALETLTFGAELGGNGCSLGPVAGRKLSPLPPWLERAKREIERSFGERVSVANLAVRLGVHPDYLSRAFRERYGMTIGVYVKRLRVDLAARLLADSAGSIADIAAAAGFADQSHLNKVFRTVLGVSPGKYRRDSRV